MLEVLLLCIKHDFKKAKERMVYLIDRVAWEPSCVVNGCQALIKYSRISVAQELCKRAFKCAAKDPLISLQLMKISLDLGDLEEFDRVVELNRNMLSKVEFSEPFIPYEGLLETRKSWDRLMDESGAKQKSLNRLIQLSEQVLIKNNLRHYQIDSFLDPEDNHLYIHLETSFDTSEDFTRLNESIIDLMVGEFGTEPPNASIQFVPAKQ